MKRSDLTQIIGPIVSEIFQWIKKKNIWSSSTLNIIFFSPQSATPPANVHFQHARSFIFDPEIEIDCRNKHTNHTKIKQSVYQLDFSFNFITMYGQLYSLSIPSSLVSMLTDLLVQRKRDLIIQECCTSLSQSEVLIGD